MSGLGGFVSFEQNSANQQKLESMAEAAGYFQPDEIGSWLRGPVGMLNARLRTTPESMSEKQPLVKGDLTLCFDGRLDNREELASFLKTHPLPATAPDSELVLALYQEFGLDFLRKLVGDFCLVIWQESNRRLFCARSVLGWRTFLWHYDSRKFTFASQPKVLFAGNDIPRKINEPIIAEILALRFTSPDETLWKGVYRLPAGSALLLQNGQPKVWRWFDGPFPDLQDLKEDECIAQFKHLLDQSLKACMRSAGPVATHLSGGLDSSSITCRAVELFRAGQVSQLVKPLSALFPGEVHDESAYSKAVTDHLGISSLPVYSQPYDWDWARKWTAETLHLPLRPNTCGVMMGVAETINPMGIKVLLTGEGGDDWFSGINTHWPDLVRQGKFVQLAKEAIIEQPNRPRWRAFATALRYGIEPWVSKRKRDALLWQHLRLGDNIPAWVRPEWAQKVSLSDRKQHIEKGFPFKSLDLQQRSARYHLARTHINFENVLAYATSRKIELRHPFHDLRLTRFAMGLPEIILRRNREKKYILRQAMKGILPEYVRTRQTKAVFVPPVLAGLDHLKTKKDLDGLICFQEGWMDSNVIWKILQGYRSLKPGEPAHKSWHITPIWLAVSMNIWLQQAEGY